MESTRPDRRLAERLGISRASDQPLAGLVWLEPANLLIAVVVVVLVFAMNLSFEEMPLR